MFETTKKQEPTPDQLNEVRRSFGLNDLLSKMNKPKQEIHNSEPTPGQGFQQNQQQQPGQQYSRSLVDEPENEDLSEPIDREVARMSGKTIAGTIDIAAGAGLSFYAKTPNPEKYQASPRQLEQLENAWQAVSMKYGYKVEDSPWLNVAVLNLAVYGPKLQDAKADRLNARMDAMQKEFEKMQAKMTVMQSEIEESEGKNKKK